MYMKKETKLKPEKGNRERIKLDSTGIGFQSTEKEDNEKEK